MTDVVRRVAGLFLVATRLTGCGADRSAVSSGTRTQPQRAERRATVDSLSSLRDIVTSGALVGHRVRVAGRCITPRQVNLLGLPRPVVVAWQLEADGVTVLVSGTPPGGCAAADGPNAVTITALVAEDTLPAIGDLPASLRRYLVPIEISQQRR